MNNVMLHTRKCHTTKMLGMGNQAQGYLYSDSNYIYLKQAVLFQHVRNEGAGYLWEWGCSAWEGKKESSQIMVLLVICCYITNHHKLKWLIKKTRIKYLHFCESGVWQGLVAFSASGCHQAAIKLSAELNSHLQDQLGKSLLSSPLKLADFSSLQLQD